jgi:hypothetical protein
LRTYRSPCHCATMPVRQWAILRRTAPATATRGRARRPPLSCMLLPLSTALRRIMRYGQRPSNADVSLPQAGGFSYARFQSKSRPLCAEVDRQRRESKTKIIRDRIELFGITCKALFLSLRISAGISARIVHVWLSQPLPNSCFADFSG